MVCHADNEDRIPPMLYRWRKVVHGSVLFSKTMVDNPSSIILEFLLPQLTVAFRLNHLFLLPIRGSALGLFNGCGC